MGCSLLLVKDLGVFVASVCHLQTPSMLFVLKI
jgi:hypothetical protein